MSGLDLNKEILINFEITHLRKVHHAIASLCDAEFNPKGMGRVDITYEGFNITVRNAKTKAAGYLFLKSSELNNYHCSRPIDGMMIDDTRIFRILSRATNDDYVNISHLEGSNALTFILGKALDSEINVEICGTNTEIERIPSIKIFCEAEFTDFLSRMINRLEANQPCKLVEVKVDMLNKFLSEVYVRRVWAYEDSRIYGTRGLTPGQIHYAWLELHHLAAMSKTLHLQAPCRIHYLTKPANRVMFHFRLRELGEFGFLYKATKLFTR